MDATELGSRTDRTLATPRIGLFGRLGSGNIGNDATMEAMLAYLRTRAPGAALDCMCSGPDQVTTRYDLQAIQIHWSSTDGSKRSRLARLAITSLRIGLGAVIDTWRTASWVRRHDVVIIPGMGVLESSPLERPWQLPYSMFLLSLFGRLFGTKVALVCVGVTDLPRGLTRRLLTTAARLAYYRSFRDDYSLNAARTLRIAGKCDHVYPDLVFALPTPKKTRNSVRTVGVGVMAYDGTGDRRSADENHAEYLDKMKHFVRWLVETDHRVRLLIGDAADDPVARAILADVQAHWRKSGALPVAYEPISTLQNLVEQIAPLDTVVATRFHNVLVALKCAKPTLSVGYGRKHDALMSQAGIGDFTQSILDLDVDQLKKQFEELETNTEQIAHALQEHNRTNQLLLERQFDELDTTLIASAGPRARGAAR